MGGMRGISSRSESSPNTDSKVVWVPPAEYAGLDGGVDEAQGTTAGSVVRARLMVGDVDRDVAFENDVSSSNNSLKSSLSGSTAAADATDEEAGSATAVDEVAGVARCKARCVREAKRAPLVDVEA